MAEQPPRRLLTVLHAAERTGPPLFALRFLRWLRAERPQWRLDTLFLDAGGDLEPEFAALGTTIVRGADHGGSWSGGRLADRSLRRQLAELRPDVVHVHCAGSMRVAPALPAAPVLCHVHELSVGLDFHLDPAARRALTSATRYVTVSDAVRKELLAAFGLDERLVDRQWGFVPDEALSTVPDRGPLEPWAGPDDVLVVSSGLRHWRKAPELFLRAAQRAHRRHPGVPWRFLWVGGSDDGRLTSLAADAGLEGAVRFVDHVEDPLHLIGAADVFLLTAREDAFPLVCVEAAALGVPIVSFDSGGTPELVRAARCGRIVPFPDVDGVVDTLAELVDDPEHRRALGAAAAAFAREHLTLGRAGPRLLSAIEGTAASA